MMRFLQISKISYSTKFLALALGGFAVYLITAGQNEAAMGAVGAAIMAATMKSEDSTRSLEDSLTIQRLELEAQNNEKIHELEQSNLRLLFEQKLLEENLDKERMRNLLESSFQRKEMELTIEMKEQMIFYLRQADNPQSLSQSFDDVQKNEENIFLTPPLDDNDISIENK
jgi:hypothetical protein